MLRIIVRRQWTKWTKWSQKRIIGDDLIVKPREQKKERKQTLIPDSLFIKNTFQFLVK